jgi:cell division protein FtsB
MRMPCLVSGPYFKKALPVLFYCAVNRNPTVLKPFSVSIPQLALVILLGLGLLQLTGMTLHTLYRHLEASGQSASERQRITALQLEVKALKERASQAREDRTYLERLARGQGFIKNGERVILPESTAPVQLEPQNKPPR